jgi:DNA-binding transcriptional LysR family regulator
MHELEGEHLLAGEERESVELAAANVGVAIMPQSLARLYARRDVVARPVTDHATTRIGLVWPEDGAHPLIDEFIGIVRGRTVNSSRAQDRKR